MRVRVNISSTTDPKITQGITALTNGHEYAVLEISAPFKRATSFRVEFIEGGLRQSALFDTRAFTVISHSLPPTWRYFQLESGSFSLCPESWNKSGFWEAYYDGDPQAIAVYEHERAAILSHS
ncbi:MULTISPECIES: hypothetical protein [unclassified Streptomyces]|uniref:hypothetical protein n=1 Tax=unclassified Streptomyces TaxID=2593676 RepID=UPI002257F337|nr:MULTISPECIES: hypothetical protein [unclassified Streptomyces]MCX4796466.1 hypothetical protein [Streptomyces sp. NBC_01242]WSJ37695.1 hypothetical protein OG772_17845 [Streptomyces sp. NBC_01321]WSP64097.1 hypothetical protein OG466_21070 [Streptomyces sp. NBC_01240]WSU23228.1 hypothetical protein OG508_21260 [Streptomyces sp. NBC_01108]